MKKLIFIAIMCVFVASPVWAGYTVTTTGGSGYGIWATGYGGEFTFHPSDNTVLQYYANSTKNQGSTDTFQTFCIETQEHIQANTTYDAYFNDRAMYGSQPPNGDPISVGTAYLYSQFAAGTLSGYNYGSGRAGSIGSSADLLQKAIWYLEQESAVYSTYNNDSEALTNNFIAIVESVFGSIASAQANYADNHVMALNLTLNGQVRQDMLVMVPIPATILLGLLGLGVGGWKLRRNAKKAV
jgi:hypothetical protein